MLELQCSFANVQWSLWFEASLAVDSNISVHVSVHVCVCVCVCVVWFTFVVVSTELAAGLDGV